MNFTDIYSQNKVSHYQNETFYWFICGSNIYNSSQIEHIRTYITYDLIKKTMEQLFGFRVFQITNISDLPSDNLSENDYENEFWKDMNKLGITKQEFVGRTSQYIPECLNIISKLIEDENAYINEGSVYFDKKSYIKKRDIDIDCLSENIDNNFILWHKSSDTQYGWNTSLGKGRPSWNLETVAIALDAQKNLNIKELCLYSGGYDFKDNYFNQKLIAEAYLDVNEDKHWNDTFIHTGNMSVNLKYSKSLKHFTTISDILDKYSKSQLRFFFLTHKFNSDIEFSEDTIDKSIELLNKFTQFFEMVDKHPFNEHLRHNNSYFDLVKHLELTKNKVEHYLLDNFRSELAIIELSKLIDYSNYKMFEETCSREGIFLIKKYIKSLFTTFDI